MWQALLPFFRRQLNPIGSRALSHDSVFIPEESAKEQHLDHSMSQENVSDKVRNLQVRLALETQARLSLSMRNLSLLLPTEADRTGHKVWPEAPLSEKK